MEFNFDNSIITLYLSLVVLINRIVKGFFTPLFDKLNIDHLWLMYQAWILASMIIFLTGLNLFVEIIPNPIVGQVLTAVAVGGGANILHDVSSG